MRLVLALPDYPKSILDDDRHVVILAYLESMGLCMEVDIATELGIDENEVSILLLNLHRDGFVNYGQRHVRPTSRCKYLLDRFNIDEDVIHSQLDDLPVDGQEKKELLTCWKLYRNTAYSQYLNTVKSVNLCRRINKSFSHEADSLFFIYRDLANTQQYLSLSEKSEIGDRSDSDCNTSTIANDASTDASSAHTRLAHSLGVLNVLRRFEERYRMMQDDKAHSKITRYLHDYQCARLKDYWFDEWTIETHNSEASELNSILQSASLLHDLGHGYGHASFEKAKTPLWFDVAEEVKDDPLTYLINKRSIAELCEETGKTEIEVITSLNLIKEACVRLLDANTDE